jgi:hypothetical protein
MSSTDPSVSRPSDSLLGDIKDLPALYHAANEAAREYQRGYITAIDNEHQQWHALIADSKNGAAHQDFT